jgi:hypothetical protein
VRHSVHGSMSCTLYFRVPSPYFLQKLRKWINHKKNKRLWWWNSRLHRNMHQAESQNKVYSSGRHFHCYSQQLNYITCSRMCRQPSICGLTRDKEICDTHYISTCSCSAISFRALCILLKFIIQWKDCDNLQEIIWTEICSAYEQMYIPLPVSLRL